MEMEEHFGKPSKGAKVEATGDSSHKGTGTIKSDFVDEDAYAYVNVEWDSRPGQVYPTDIQKIRITTK